MLKGGKAPSLWLRNMQLAAYSAVIAVASLLCTADPVAREQVSKYVSTGYAPPLPPNPNPHFLLLTGAWGCCTASTA